MTASYTWELPADATAPGQARWHLRQLLESDSEAIDAELVATELITNAWRHGRGPITLIADLRPDCLMLEVCSESDAQPNVRTDAGASSGRGLLLIEELTTAWGFTREGDQMCVWAEIAIS
jgi:anti-sigma regulatory factor (Ser/Thr protein kinase)